MRELSQIIDQLHVINEQVIEKDNMLNHMQSVVSLVSQMITDTLLVRSDAYLDLKFKYLGQIEEHLKKISQCSKNGVAIEPENLYQNKGSGKKHVFYREDIVAPIRTDIYTAPSCRKIFTRKKIDTCNKKEVKKSDNETSYVSFDYQNERYYINVTSSTTDITAHLIYNDLNKLMGQLRDGVITLLTQPNPETIQLKTVTSDSGLTQLFGSYYGGQSPP